MLTAMTTVRSGTGRTDGRSLDAVGAGPTLLSSSPSLLPNEVITIGSGSLKLGTNSSPLTHTQQLGEEKAKIHFQEAAGSGSVFL